MTSRSTRQARGGLVRPLLHLTCTDMGSGHYLVPTSCTCPWIPHGGVDRRHSSVDNASYFQQYWPCSANNHCPLRVCFAWQVDRRWVARSRLSICGI